MDLLRGDFRAIAPPFPALAAMFPFVAANPLILTVQPAFASGSPDPTPGILTDAQIPLAFYQVAPDTGLRLFAVKDALAETLVFTLR